MISTCRLALLILGIALCAPPISAQDLSRYRDFQFGSDLQVVVKQTGMMPSDATTTHGRPALIQGLEWRPSRALAEPPVPAESVKDLAFSFYNGKLFRMVINYDPDRTEGLTDEDMIEAISARYGTAKRPKARTIGISFVQSYSDSETIIACWEDAQYSFNLFRSSYQRTFGLVVFSKRLDGLARAAVAAAARLDQQEAPQRVKDQAQQSRLAQEKARLLNKPTFRP